MIPDARVHAAAPWVALALLISGCDAAAPEETGGLAASTYVNVVSDLADLQRFPPPGADSTARRTRADSVRQVILDRYGVTAAELIEFAERVGLQPDRMESISERIVARTDSLAHVRADASMGPDSVSLDAVGADSARESAVDSDSAADAAADAAADSAADAAVLESIRLNGRARQGARSPARAEPIPIRGDDGEPVDPRRRPTPDRPPRG